MVVNQPDGAGQVDIAAKLLVTPVALDVDGDRRAANATAVAHEFRSRQGERDQQDVLHPGVERRRHLSEQHAGRLGIQLHRKVPGRGERVQGRLHRGQQGGGPGNLSHLPPGIRLSHDILARACSLSSDAQRWNDVPPTGNATGCPARCWAQAMFKSSNKIRHDTASTAK